MGTEREKDISDERDIVTENTKRENYHSLEDYDEYDTGKIEMPQKMNKFIKKTFQLVHSDGYQEDTSSNDEEIGSGLDDLNVSENQEEDKNSQENNNGYIEPEKGEDKTQVSGKEASRGYDEYMGTEKEEDMSQESGQEASKDDGENMETEKEVEMSQGNGQETSKDDYGNHHCRFCLIKYRQQPTCCLHFRHDINYDLRFVCFRSLCHTT